MKKLLSLLFLLFSSCSLWAQEGVYCKPIMQSDRYSNFNITGSCIDTPTESLLIYGSFYGTVIFDNIGAGQVVRSSANGSYRKFISVYSLEGQFRNLIEWNDTFPSAYNLTGVHCDGLGNILVSGYGAGIDFDSSSQSYYFSASGNNKDPWIAKYSMLDGSLKWVKALGYTNAAYVGNLFTDDMGSIYFTGAYTDSLDLDPSPTNHEWLVSQGLNDAVLASWSKDGVYKWKKSIHGLKEEIIRTVHLKDNEITAVGLFQHYATFDDLTGTMLAANQGSLNTDIFISKYSLNGNFISVKQIGGYKDQILSDAAFSKSGKILLSGVNSGEISVGLGVDTFFDESFLFELDENLNLAGQSPITNNVVYQNVGVDDMSRIVASGEYRAYAELDRFGASVGNTSMTNWEPLLSIYDTDKKSVFLELLSGPRGIGATEDVFYYDNSIYVIGTGKYILANRDTLGSLMDYSSLADTSAYVYLYQIRYWPDALEDLASENSQLRVFPNPSRDKIQIECRDAWQPERLYICDVSSRILREQPYSAEIDIRDLPTGTYILGLMDDQGNRRAAVFQRQ